MLDQKYKNSLRYGECDKEVVDNFRYKIIIYDLFFLFIEFLFTIFYKETENGGLLLCVDS